MPVQLTGFTIERSLALLLLVSALALALIWLLLGRARPASARLVILLVPPALLVGGYLLAFGGPGLGGTPTAVAIPDAAAVANGQALFAQNCVVCHGPTGRGDGPNAAGLQPRPTDFGDQRAAGRDDAALLAAINVGVAGTGMPAWGETFDARERQELVWYLRALNPLTADRVPAPPALAAVATATATATAPAEPAPTVGASPAEPTGDPPTPPPVAVAATPVSTASPVPPTEPASAAPTATATGVSAATATASPTTAPPTAAPTAAPTATPAPPFVASRVRASVESVGTGFATPLYITHAGDGSGRLFILEKVGRIRLLNGTTFLDLTARVNSPPLLSYEREQGLLGLAFHPRFRENGYLYVHYNGRDGNHVISRFTARPGGVADPASEKILLRQNQPQTNFNGGQLLFGPDGFLYLGLGTGGTDRALQDNAQDRTSLLGKILRLDVDGGDPYGIPPGNPFVGTAGARPEIWAYGLRNPWRFSFDRATGDLYIASPGEFKREWVQFHPAGGPAGQNFGWPVLEGTICWREATCAGGSFPPPIVEYPTYEGGNCAVIGGYVYRGQRSPRLTGAYLFGDFCGGRIYAAARDAGGKWSQAELTRINGLIGSLGEDEAGEVYVADIQNGTIYRLVGDAR